MYKKSVYNVFWIIRANGGGGDAWIIDEHG
jgi:hypothetical protein